MVKRIVNDHHVFTFIVSLLLIFSLIIFLVSCDLTKKNLIINEYMNNNIATIRDEECIYPDWIELYNDSSIPVNLKGYGLSDSEKNPSKWEFSDIVINGKSYVIVFASGKNRLFYNNEPERTYIHTNFTFNKTDSFLIFSDPKGDIIDRIKIIQLDKDISYARVLETGDSDWIQCDYPTPGFENTYPGHKNYISKKKKENPVVLLNEVMVSNSTSLIDDNGEFSDWIELYNSSGEYVSLEQYGLSDDRNNLAKWVFPGMVMLPGQYLVVFASGKVTTGQDYTYIHANFRLNAKQEVLFFSDPGGFVLDKVKIDNHSRDVSFGRNTDNQSEWIFFTIPTPGYKNDEKGINNATIQAYSGHKGMYISEVIPVGYDKQKDEDYDISDIIEIHNKNKFTVNLKDYYLSDDPDELLKWEFPVVLLQPDSYIYVFASGKDRYTRYIHTNFRLGPDKEDIFLSHKTAGVLDKIPIKAVPFGSSYGRTPYNDECIYFSTPTPGKSNATGLRGFAGKVEVSLQGGKYDTPQYVEINGKVDEIYYTLDGSEPDRASRKYTSPVLIEKTTVVRTRGFTEGLLPGEITTYSFFFNLTHELPVISLVTDPYHLLDPIYGMMTEKNLQKKMEKPVHIEFFEEDGFSGFHLNAGIRLFGHSSRMMDQRPFYIITRKRYGESTIKYRVFPGKDIRIYKSLLLRNGGEDGKYSRIRDRLTSTLVRELGVDAQASRPAVIYINGEYWGQYYIRDKIDEYFLAYHHNVNNPSDIDLIEGNQKVMSGSYTALWELKQYISTHDLRKQEVYEYVKTLVDIDNLINYELAQIYFANTDMGNVRCWRERSLKGKWRWILFDTDWSLFIFERNAFKWNLDPGGRGYLKYFSTLIITRLLRNEEFKAKFISRCVYLLETTFSSGYVSALIDNLVKAIESEMPAHCKRWKASIEEWKRQVQRVRRFARERPAYVMKHLKSYFDLSDEDLEKYSS